jgi:ElaB/YqjD/DUF883 family membrane-anchored ribosome-binding protein
MSTRAKEATKDQLIEQFNVVVAETEQLLKSVADAGGEKAGALRASVDRRGARPAAEPPLMQVLPAMTG